MDVYTHALKTASANEALQFKCETLCCLEALRKDEDYDLEELIKLADRLVERAIGQRKQRKPLRSSWRRRYKTEQGQHTR